jgi:hypothetical protein
MEIEIKNHTMSCTSCEYFKKQPISGLYNMTCVKCCARLIRSARPLKAAQQAMFASIKRHQGAPSKAAILQAIVELDGKVMP